MFKNMESSFDKDSSNEYYTLEDFDKDLPQMSKEEIEDYEKNAEILRFELKETSAKILPLHVKIDFNELA